MNDFLSIREFAGMMGVSVHQVRYFEEKGLLLPAHMDPNGYRRYGWNEMYRLSHILLLRQLGISVADIENVIRQANSEKIKQLLTDSLKSVEDEIIRLQRLQQFTLNVLSEQENISLESVKGEKVILSARRLRKWLDLKSDPAEITARSLFQADTRPSALFETDLFYIWDKAGCSLYFELKSNEESDPQDLLLEPGSYWRESFTAANDTEAEHYVEAACHRLEERFELLSYQIIVAEKSYSSLFDEDSVRFELLVRIDED